MYLIKIQKCINIIDSSRNMLQLAILESEKRSLLELWEEKRILYEQCMDLQLFVRDTEQADAWMTKQEVGCFFAC